MKFPVFSQLAGNFGFRDGFARDSLLQQRVCELSVPERRLPPRRSLGRMASRPITPADYNFIFQSGSSGLGEARAGMDDVRSPPRFVLIGAYPRFPILRNAEEMICRRYKAAQLRHSAYYSHPQRAMR